MASYISGMTSGLDWTSMISQLVEMESRSIQLLETDKEEINDRYDSWVEVNSKLLSLKTVAASLSELDDFDQYTSSSSITGTTYDVDDMLSYAVGSNASQGSYSLKINNLAQAEKLGSISFSSLSEAVGIAGDLLINGNVVNIAADDSLNDIKNKINALNSGENPAGVTASIFTMGEGEYRLTLTSQETGSSGIDIANGSSSDVLGQLGFADDAVSLSNPITSGAQSSGFTSSTQDIEALLGLNSAASGNVTIAGQSIAIDLSSDSLQSIRDTINNNANLQTLGVSASIVSETNGS
ncbi:MAG: flagellar hook protein, partial [Deltaproteobacteria bacterium]|nr:flagellar hook protein [Deltaproteobacteria bacterium]